jgi:cardiolipin synthase
VLDPKNRVCAPGSPPRPRALRHRKGSGGRVVAGAAHLGDAVSAAITDRRVLEPREGRLALVGAALLLLLAALAVFHPRVIAWGLAAVAVWLALSLVSRGLSLGAERRRRDRQR